MTANGWTGGLNKLFMLFTSSGEGSCFDSTGNDCAYSDKVSGYCGYHSYIAGTPPIIYANEPYGNPTAADIEHVYAEMTVPRAPFRGHIPERDGVLAGLMVADMIVDYGKPLSQIVERLFSLVGPHAYKRHDIRFEREGYPQRKEAVYERMEKDTPRELAGEPVVRTRTDDGFKFYLGDGSWALMRMSGTEPLMRVYSEAATPARVDELISALAGHQQSG